MNLESKGKPMLKVGKIRSPLRYNREHQTAAAPALVVALAGILLWEMVEIMRWHRSCT